MFELRPARNMVAFRITVPVLVALQAAVRQVRTSALAMGLVEGSGSSLIVAGCVRAL